MFETLRGTEYGWSPDIDEHSFDKAVLKSYLFECVVGLLRADSPEQWRKETIEMLDDFYPGWMLGSPMQTARINMRQYRKTMLIYRVLMEELYPLGFASGHILRKPESKLNTNWKKFLYVPAETYDTNIAQVTFQKVRVKNAEWLMDILKKETGGDEFDHADEDLRKELSSLTKAFTRTQGIWTVMQWGWLPRSQYPEELEARDYMTECERYQASKAGRRAKRLLVENLTDVQERDYFKLGHFFVVPPQPDRDLHERRIYAIERNFPNGNVMQVKLCKTRNRKNFTWFPTKSFCYHTVEPHAIDDIILGQKLLLEHDEEEFWNQAHVLHAPLRGQYALGVVKRGV